MVDNYQKQILFAKKGMPSCSTGSNCSPIIVRTMGKSMAGLFGTDGVRARVNTGPMTAEAVVRLALAAGRWFADHNDRSNYTRPIVVIGKDTRLSGYAGVGYGGGVQLNWS